VQDPHAEDDEEPREEKDEDEREDAVTGWSVGEPRRLPPLSMAAGEFVEVFGRPHYAGVWDAVATCFFIDTAPVVTDYIDVIWTLLHPGGVWANLGPLLFHWESAVGREVDNRYDVSVELTLEELMAAVRRRGFLVLEEEQHRELTYASDPHSMVRTVFTAAFFVAQKPGP
jgi:carnosine N-methyltransferase